MPVEKVASMKTAEIGDLVKLMMNHELWRVSNAI